MRSGLTLPGPQQSPQMVIAAPFNDVQLVSMMAVHLEGDARQRVSLALDIVAEAMLSMPELKGKVDARKALRE